MASTLQLLRLFLLFASFTSIAAAAAKVMDNFDFEKFTSKQWWVTHRGIKYHRFDRCMRVSFGRRFKNRGVHTEIDHVNSGAIDKSYYPITPTKTGYHLMLQDGVEADINFLDTDYETYGILKVTLIEGDNSADHLCIVSDSPSLADGLTSTVSDLMQELGGQSLSEIEQINNEDCPIDSKTSQAV